MMEDIGSEGNAIHGRRRVRVPLAVIGALLVVLAAETVFARSQPEREALASATVIRFGAERQASVQVGEGWVLDEAASDLNSQLVLRRGRTVVELSIVVFNGPKSPEEIWGGLGRLLDIERRSGEHVRLDDPSEFETASGVTGLEGALAIGGLTGTAFVVPGRDGLEAVDAKILAPPDTGDAEREAAADLIGSITFEEES